MAQAQMMSSLANTTTNSTRTKFTYGFFIFDITPSSDDTENLSLSTHNPTQRLSLPAYSAPLPLTKLRISLPNPNARAAIDEA